MILPKSGQNRCNINCFCYFQNQWGRRGLPDHFQNQWNINGFTNIISKPMEYKWFSFQSELNMNGFVKIVSKPMEYYWFYRNNFKTNGISMVLPTSIQNHIISMFLRNSFFFCPFFPCFHLKPRSDLQSRAFPRAIAN